MALHIGPANNGPNHSIFLAVDAAAGVMLLEHKSGAYDADTFVEAFQRPVEAYIARDSFNVAFICDNCHFIAQMI
jgi:hypothetical protein